MTQQIYSPTGGVLIISMPSRGVSWVSPGKTLKCEETQMGGFKRTRIARVISDKDRHASGKWNLPSEDRQQQLVQPTTQQICHITADVEEVWTNSPMKEEFKYGPQGKKFVPLYKPEQRFQRNLSEHFMYICEQAGINPSNCSYTWNPTTSVR